MTKIKIVLLILILNSFTNCRNAPDNQEYNSKDFNPLETPSEEEEYAIINSEVVNDSIVRITKRLCAAYQIPLVDFSILPSSNYIIEKNPIPGSAIRLREINNDTLVSEITIGTLEFQEKFTAEQESKWYTEFYNDPVWSNPDVKLFEAGNTELNGKDRMFYLMSFNPTITEFPKNESLMTIGFLLPNQNSTNGLAINITKSKINRANPLNKNELKTINSIRFND